MRQTSFLWPDHVIGKRESRRIREEHNELANHAEALAKALEAHLTAIGNYPHTPGLTYTDEMIVAKCDGHNALAAYREKP